ncbi:hypothetical protein ACROYT_G041109 [Oculina patagonica]
MSSGEEEDVYQDRGDDYDDDDGEEDDDDYDYSDGDDDDDDDQGDDDGSAVKKERKKPKRSKCPVFLSYQWDLQETVKGLKSKIDGNGVKCWMDIGQMGGGDSLLAKIDAGIRGCKVFVCCVTEKYCQSETCQNEATLAHSLKKPIIPLLFDDISWPPEGQLSMIFAKLLYIKMTGKDAEFQQLMTKVKGFINPEN